jgi:NADH-ubiquinone oxidoreductase-F iron-sulfur binding region
MNENEYVLVSVSAHKGADEVFKKLKKEIDALAKGKVLVMRSVLNDDNNVMVQIYPFAKVFPSLNLEQTDAVCSYLFSSDTSVQQSPDAQYVSDLATLLRANMAAMEPTICGKCYPCRLGGPLIDTLLQHYQSLQPFDKQQVTKQLCDAGTTMKSASMCAIGMFGANPLLFALEKWPTYFVPQGVIDER